MKSLQQVTTKEVFLSMQSVFCATSIYSFCIYIYTHLYFYMLCLHLHNGLCRKQEEGRRERQLSTVSGLGTIPSHTGARVISPPTSSIWEHGLHRWQVTWTRSPSEEAAEVRLAPRQPPKSGAQGSLVYHQPPLEPAEPAVTQPPWRPRLPEKLSHESEISPAQTNPRHSQARLRLSVIYLQQHFLFTVLPLFK